MQGYGQKISVDHAKEALLRSGYLLESRLDTVLRKKGYYVETNVAYPDPHTGKSREMDIYAMQAMQAGKEEYDYIFLVLLIECVNNPQPIAFFTKKPQVGFTFHHEIKHAGIPVKIPVKGERDSWESLLDYLEMDKYHHYCRGLVATQFCSFTKKRIFSPISANCRIDSLTEMCLFITIGMVERLSIIDLLNLFSDF